MNAHANPEDFDLYALGALDGEELQRFEAHLRSCKDCQRQLAEARSVSVLIGLAAPPLAPPPKVKAELMETIKKEKSTREAATSQTVLKPAPRRVRWGLRFALGFAISTIALALVCSWLWKMDTLHEQQLSRVMTHLQKVEATQQQNQAAMQAMTRVMSAPDTIQIDLAHQAGTPPGNAHVLYNARMGIVVYSGVISPAPSDKSYQLWLVPDSGAPVSAGLVEADQESGAAVAHLPQGLAAKAFAVTLEPKGGRPQPTGPKVLVGAVGSA
jgi:anti-sigma-K factor RskA